MKRTLVLLSFIVYAFLGVAQSIHQDFIFQENKGQLDSRIKFTAQQNGVKMYLGAKSIHYVWNKYENLPVNALGEPDSLIHHMYRLDLELVGANLTPHVEKVNPSEDFVNYYNGFNEGIMNVRQYGKVVYKNVYDGIDWVWHNNSGTIKYDFIVHPGADYKQIKIKVAGATETSITPEGGLIIKTPFGEINDAPPVSFINNKQATTQFVIENQTISFKVEDYQKTETLTIDPSLLWSTYYGGSELEFGGEVAVVSNKDIYLVSSTYSDDNIFFNGFQQKKVGKTNSSGFIVKFDETGKRLWATYFGGYGFTSTSRFTFAVAVAVDNNDNAYITGRTNVRDSIAKNAYQSVVAGNYDAFLAKFSPDGGLSWATYYGGEYAEIGIDIKVKNTDVYLGGNTYSKTGISKTNINRFKNNKGQDDIFLANFDTAGALKYGYYIGGPIDEALTEIAITSNGGIVLAGTTTSTNSFATTGLQTNYGGGSKDVFISYINNADSLAWQTYYGGSGSDSCSGLVLDNDDNIYVAGSTTSSNNIATTGAYKTTLSGNSDAFIAKLNLQGNREWATYYGGENDESTNGIGISTFKEIVFAGSTSSTTNINLNGFQAKATTSYDMFIGVLDKNGVRSWGSYYGDVMPSLLKSFYLDKNDIAYLAGTTRATSFFGVNGHQNQHGGGTMDMFLSVFRYKDLYPLSPSKVGPFCGLIDYVFIASRSVANFDIGWFNEESDTIPFFVGDTLKTTLVKPDTLWLAFYSSNYLGPKKSVVADIIPVPSIAFSISDTSVCQIKNKVVVTNLQQDSTASYTWDFGDGFLSSLPIDTHTYVNPGTYIIALRGKFKNSSCTGSKSKVVSVLKTPLNQTINGNLTSTQGKTEVYSAKDVVGSKYVWNITNGVIVGSDSTSSVTVVWDTIATKGKVELIEVNSLGCSSFPISREVGLSLKPSSVIKLSQASIKVYPNPARQQLTISTHQSIEYRLLDLTGRQVLSGQVKTIGSENIALNRVVTGVYYLQIIQESQLIETIKVVVR